MANATAIVHLSQQPVILFRHAAQLGAELAESLERGQMRKPIAERFAVLSNHSETSPFCVGLISADSASRIAALEYLCGDQCHVASIPWVTNTANMEITLKERGYAIGQSDGSTLVFDRVEPFLDALQVSEISGAESGDHLLAEIKLRLQQGAHAQQLRIISPQSIDKNNVERLIGEFAASTNALIVAAPAHFVRDAINASLCQAIAGAELVLPLVFGERCPELPEGWWQNKLLQEAPILFPPVFISDGKQNITVPLLADACDPLRQLLHISQLTCNLRTAVGLTTDRFEAETRRLASYQARCMHEQRAIEDGNRSQDLRLEFEPIRSEFQDEMTRLNAGLVEMNRKAILHGGALGEIVDEISGNIAVADIDQEVTPKYTRLSIRESCLVAATNQLRQVLRRRLKEDMIIIRDAVDLMRDQLQRQLGAISGSAVSISLTMPEEHAAWEVLDPLVQIDLKYKAEFPRRTFIHRIMEGRKPVAMILMTLSVFSGLIQEVRKSTVFIVGVPLIFLWGIAQTFRSFAVEDRERVDKELEKVKEGITSEIKRIISDVQREKTTRLSAYLSSIVKEAIRGIDATMREVADMRIRNLEQMKAEFKLRSRSLDQRAKTMQLLAPRVAKLAQSCTEVETTVKKSLLESANAAKAGIA